MNFVNDIKTVEMAQSYRLCTWHKSKQLLFAVISSGYRSQALLYTHSDQRYIRRYGIHEHYIHPCWVRVDLYKAGDETRLQIVGSASALWLYSARGKYSSNTSSFLSMGGNSKMAVEIKRCRGDGPSSSLLSSSGPEGERLSKILCISIPVQWFQTLARIDAKFPCLK